MQLATAVTPATPAKTTKEARGAFTLTAGEQLKAEIGAEIELDTACPAGKVWLVTLHVHVVETDA